MDKHFKKPTNLQNCVKFEQKQKNYEKMDKNQQYCANLERRQKTGKVDQNL